jgi:hypothetical protein
MYFHYLVAEGMVVIGLDYHPPMFVARGQGMALVSWASDVRCIFNHRVA